MCYVQNLTSISMFHLNKLFNDLCLKLNKYF